MFEALTEKLNDVFKNLTGKGRLSEKDVDEGLRQVRLALLEADVNFRVARDLAGKIRERSIGSDVLESLTPGQQVIKIVNEELTAILTGGDHDLAQPSSQPGIVLLVGLQGSGKTTTAAKLASKLGEGGKKVLLVAGDLRRPAAIDQLVVLGQQTGVPVYREDTSSTPAKVAKAGVAEALRTGAAWVIVDTGGRLHIDDELMKELEQVRDAIQPHETLLVVDAMTGQDAVRAAEAFHDRVRLSGLVLTKLDGDSRGGAALSITQVTGIPIKLIGVGERTDALEQFHPDRLASRILGMGDVLSLIEKAQQVVDEKQAKEMERKLRTASFDLEDFLAQFQSLKKMGFAQVLDMVPGLSQLKSKAPDQFDEKKIIKFEAIIRSMTPQERHTPEIIDGRRRRRISQGSGTTPQDVNQLLNQFKQANKLMKQMSQARSPKDLAKLFR